MKTTLKISIVYDNDDYDIIRSALRIVEHTAIEFDAEYYDESSSKVFTTHKRTPKGK